MAARIFDFPGEDLRPAGQPLIFSIDDTGTAPDRYVVVVKRSDGFSGTTVEVAKFYLTPNANDVAFFDLSPIAESIVTYPLAVGTTPVHQIDDVEFMDGLCVQRFIVQVGSYNSGTETLNQDSEQIFVMRGTEQISQGLHPSFDDYLWGNAKGWLSERTSVDSFLPGVQTIPITMRSDEERVISLAAAEDMGRDVTAPRVRYSFIPFSGATVSYDFNVTFTGITENRLRQIPIGWANISGLQSTYTLDQIDYIWITLQKDSTTTPTTIGDIIELRYDDTTGCRNTATQVGWINTRGGWEYLLFTSRAPKQISVEGKNYRKTIGSYNDATFSFNADQSQYETFGKTGKEQYTLQENFFSAEERGLLDSLMKSNVVQIRRLDESVWKPVNVLTNSLTIQPSGSQFYNVSLQVEIAQDIRC
jgi:hypothetical protein